MSTDKDSQKETPSGRLKCPNCGYYVYPTDRHSIFDAASYTYSCLITLGDDVVLRKETNGKGTS